MNKYGNMEIFIWRKAKLFLDFIKWGGKTDKIKMAQTQRKENGETSDMRKIPQEIKEETMK